MSDLPSLHQLARGVFDSAVASAIELQSTLEPVSWNASDRNLAIADYRFDLRKQNTYAIAIGKAANGLAHAVDWKLGDAITAGVLASPQSNIGDGPTGWQTFTGGHPLPNGESLAAAQAAFALLERAERERAVVIFLISGGGSAVIEWPVNNRISLEDLRETNRVLVSCGATIGEINAVRRRISAVKGGRLAARAPHANKITLIVSDVNRGEESIVASGPTLPAPPNAPDANEVILRYGLSSLLPASVIATLNESAVGVPPHLGNHTSHVLVDNQRLIEIAASKLRVHPYYVEVEEDTNEQPIGEGCDLLLKQVAALIDRARSHQMPAVSISGGEFSCPVRGNGAGGRNLETALRFAIGWDRRYSQSLDRSSSRHIVLLSAGTDGIDGNSSAAGAIVDETTIARGRALGLDAEAFLANSDAFHYFATLGDAIVIGPTGTNVRDFRFLLADS